MDREREEFHEAAFPASRKRARARTTLCNMPRMAASKNKRERDAESGI